MSHYYHWKSRSQGEENNHHQDTITSQRINHNRAHHKRVSVEQVEFFRDEDYQISTTGDHDNDNYIDIDIDNISVSDIDNVDIDLEHNLNHIDMDNDIDDDNDMDDDDDDSDNLVGDHFDSSIARVNRYHFNGPITFNGNELNYNSDDDNYDGNNSNSDDSDNSNNSNNNTTITTSVEEGLLNQSVSPSLESVTLQPSSMPPLSYTPSSPSPPRARKRANSHCVDMVRLLPFERKKSDTCVVTVWFGTTLVTLKNFVSIEDVCEQPTLYWDASCPSLSSSTSLVDNSNNNNRHNHNSQVYTVMMWDHDAPYPSPDNSDAPLMHWMVMNIPGNEIEKGHTIVEYRSPSPPLDSAPHRYSVALFHQIGGHIDPNQKTFEPTRHNLEHRENINIEYIVELLGLVMYGLVVFQTGFVLPTTFKHTREQERQQHLARIAEQQTLYERQRAENKQLYRSCVSLSSSSSSLLSPPIISTTATAVTTTTLSPSMEEKKSHQQRKQQSFSGGRHQRDHSRQDNSTISNRTSRQYVFNSDGWYVDYNSGDGNIIIYPRSPDYSQVVGSPPLGTLAPPVIHPSQIGDQSARIMEQVSI